MAALPGQQFDIELSGASIRYRQYTTGGTAQWNYYPVSHIKCVESAQVIGFGTRDSVTNQRKNSTRQDDLLRITISFLDDTKPLIFDIQNVMNQAGWTPNAAGVTQALTDINTWIVTGSGITGGLATQATLAHIESMLDGAVSVEYDDVNTADFPYTLAADTYFSADVVVLSGSVFIQGSTIPLPVGSYPHGGDPNQPIISLNVADASGDAVVVVRKQQKL